MYDTYKFIDLWYYRSSFAPSKYISQNLYYLSMVNMHPYTIKREQYMLYSAIHITSFSSPSMQVV